ncbi:fatty acid desaturase 2-like isoform X1 [Argonauta hians]
MGRGGENSDQVPPNPKADASHKVYSWEEIRKHNQKCDRWLVIDRQVYNITNWAQRHPGGSKVIGHYAGQDATEAFRAFHNDLAFVRKFLKPLHIGSLSEEEFSGTEISADFEELRRMAEKMGLFKPSYCFFFLNIGHVLVLEVFAYLTLKYLGTGWLPYLLSVLFYSIVQAQTGWIQHDFGHLSVFKRSKLDHFWHYFTMGFIKGASPAWWSHMHYQHHAKPNVLDKDPDIRIDKCFVIGDTMSLEVAKKKKKSMPYNFQHRYFFIIGPPLLFPVYFQYALLHYAISRRAWADLAWMAAFFLKIFYLYTPFLGFWGVLAYYFVVRCVESHWFTWVSQSNHIPMDVEHDTAQPWLALQLHATCDIEKSFFNDWFTGHLNFQIEHHLFPTMPRHNLYKIAPYVKSLCEKHGIKYQVKPLGKAFVDVVRTLKHSGEIWYAAYQAHHML